MPYKLCFKVVSGYMEKCHYCGEVRCSGCPVPYVADVTVKDILQNFKLTNNDTLFSNDRMVNGKEFQVEVVWHQDLHQSLFSFLATATPLQSVNLDESD